MQPLSVSQLLDVWERGLGAPPYERALALLSAASPEFPPAVMARASIGQRDTGLLTLREWAFGTELALLATCPACGEILETTLQTDVLRPAADAAAIQETTMACDGFDVRIRPPNTTDLMAATAGDVQTRRRRLFARCVVDAQREGVVIAADDLPEAVMERAAHQLATLDPQADLRIGLTCPECHHAWAEPFDIANFFWTEIDAWARRLLRDINVLAKAYGWRESDVLALSPARREIYVAMARA